MTMDILSSLTSSTLLSLPFEVSKANTLNTAVKHNWYQSIQDVRRYWCSHVILWLLFQPTLSLNTRLWNNPSLPHFYSISDPWVWAQHSTTFFNDIVEGGHLVSFANLSAKCRLPSQYYFRYVQVVHAFRSQPPRGSITILQSVLESLLWEDCLSKPTSALHQILLSDTTPKLSSLRKKWQLDIPDLDQEDWEKLWDKPFRQQSTDPI